MKVLSKLDNHVIVQYTKKEFELLNKVMEQPVKHSLDSIVEPSNNYQKEPEPYVGPTMTFKYGGQTIRKTQEELAFEDYRGPFIPD